VILLRPSSAIALAEDASAVRSVSTDGISEAERSEFRHATAAPIFGSLEVKFLSDQASNGSFQFTTSMRFANISRIGTRRWPAPFVESGLAIFSHTGPMKPLTKPAMGVTHASILGV
jgi:hypothetical protein